MSYIPSFLTRAPQYGSITIINGQTTATGSFTSATGTVVLMWMGSGGVDGAGTPNIGQAHLAYSGTTITATRNTADTDSMAIYWAVFHIHSSFVLSTEQGSTSLASATTANTTVTAVAKGWLVPQGWITNDTNAGTAFNTLNYTYDGSTTVTVARDGNGGTTCTAKWILIGLR